MLPPRISTKPVVEGSRHPFQVKNNNRRPNLTARMPHAASPAEGGMDDEDLWIGQGEEFPSNGDDEVDNEKEPSDEGEQPQAHTPNKTRAKTSTVAKERATSAGTANHGKWTARSATLGIKRDYSPNPDPNSGEGFEAFCNLDAKARKLILRLWNTDRKRASTEDDGPNKKPKRPTLKKDRQASCPS